MKKTYGEILSTTQERMERSDSMVVPEMMPYYASRSLAYCLGLVVGKKFEGKTGDTGIDFIRQAEAAVACKALIVYGRFGKGSAGATPWIVSRLAEHTHVANNFVNQVVDASSEFLKPDMAYGFLVRFNEGNRMFVVRNAGELTEEHFYSLSALSEDMSGADYFVGTSYDSGILFSNGTVEVRETK